MTPDERSLAPAEGVTAECDDGTICENSSPCVPHPLKEGSYMCDCAAAKGSADGTIMYAGVYCEHAATSYCQKGSDSSGHAFCANGGECKFMVGRDEAHAGCKCPEGYEGSYCQFVEGSVPSDWSLDSFMHPQLVRAYARRDDSDLVGVLVGIVVGLFLLASVLCCYFYLDTTFLREQLRRKEKEMDTGSSQRAPLAGRRSSASPGNAEFVGGKSVYRKTSTPHFVDENTLDADGGVLKEALGAGPEGDEDEDAPGLGEGGGASMEEVDLDDMPGTLSGGKGEMA